MRKRVINNITLVLLVLLFLFCECPIQAAAESPAEIISESVEVLKEMSSAEDSGAFGALLKKAKGIAIFPSIIKIGWGVGGQYGKGMILRKDSRTGIWYGPTSIFNKNILKTRYSRM